MKEKVELEFLEQREYPTMSFVGLEQMLVKRRLFCHFKWFTVTTGQAMGLT